MGGAFTIPSIFTAIDRYTAPIRGMDKATAKFGRNVASVVEKSNGFFKKLTPTFSGLQREILSLASTAAIVGGIFAGISFSFDAIKNYETELANLQAVTGASGKEFALFKSQIQSVAKELKVSSVDTAKAFTAIGNNQPELLKSADGLAAVARASILLSQASKMDLEPSAKALTTIMNQFGLSAGQAAKTIDILSAGAQAGSSELSDTAAAIQKFGIAAKNAGLDFKTTVGLVEANSKILVGIDAGEKFKSVLTTISTIKVQDPKALKDLARLHVNLKIVSDQSKPFAERLKELSKISKDNAAMFHVFGRENINMAIGMLQNADALKTMVSALDKTGVTAEMAAKNNDTFSISIEQMKAKWVNMITGADQTSVALTHAKNVVHFLTDNMETIVAVGVKVLLFMAAWKSVIITTRAVVFVYNVVLGVYNALFTRTLVLTTQNIVAQKAFAIASKIGVFAIDMATKAQWLWNAAMTANPIGLLIAAIAALIALVAISVRNWNTWGAALLLALGPLSLVVSMVQSFRRNWEMVTQAFSHGGILGGLKAIGAVLLDSILMPIQQVLKLVEKLTHFEWAGKAMSSIASARSALGVNTATDESGKPLSEKATINPEANRQEAMVQRMETKVSQNLDININDKSNGKASFKSDNNITVPKLTTTHGFN